MTELFNFSRFSQARILTAHPHLLMMRAHPDQSKLPLHDRRHHSSIRKSRRRKQRLRRFKQPRCMAMVWSTNKQQVVEDLRLPTPRSNSPLLCLPTALNNNLNSPRLCLPTTALHKDHNNLLPINILPLNINTLPLNINILPLNTHRHNNSPILHHQHNLAPHLHCHQNQGPSSSSW